VKQQAPGKPLQCPCQSPTSDRDQRLPLDAAAGRRATDTAVKRGSLPCMQAVPHMSKTKQETADRQTRSTKLNSVSKWVGG